MTRNEYMRALARGLRWKCGSRETADILAEYQQSFERGLAAGESEEVLCENFGFPSAVAAALARESRTPFMALPWVRLLLLAAAALFVAANSGGPFFIWSGGMEYLLILILPVVLYFVADGPELGRIGQQKPRGRGAKLILAILSVCAVLCAAFIFLTVYHLDGVYRLYLRFIHVIHDGQVWRNMVKGAVFQASRVMMVMAAGAWLWARHMALGGKWLFPSGAVVISLVIATSNLSWLSMSDVYSSEMISALSIDLLLGVVMALLLALILPDFQREKDETAGRVERVAALTREPVCGLFLDALSKALTFRFGRWEKREILEDYAECFAAGMEEGRSAESLCGEFGPPEKVAEILCRERRGGYLSLPGAKLAAALLLAGAFYALYGCVYDRLAYVSLLKYGFVILVILAAPFLLSLAAWKEPVIGMKRLALRLTPLYLCALLTLAVPPLIILAILCDWMHFPFYSGPLVMGILYMGLAAVCAATVLELRGLPRQWRLPPLFVNVGYIAANAQMVWMLSQMSAPEGGLALCVEALLPLTIGLILALLCGAVTGHIHGGGFGGGMTICSPSFGSRRERIDRVKRISVQAMDAQRGGLL